jgi:NitT/TauT family transport system substrate-binding protein
MPSAFRFLQRLRLGIVPALLALVAVPLACRAEVSELRIPLGAGGFGFLPLHIMQKYGLIEKQAAQDGLKLSVNWSNLGGAAVMNDALLSGSAHFISAGPPGFLVLWDRTRSNVGVRAVAAISSLPMTLNARVAQLPTLEAIGANQKIAVTSVKVSIPSIIMQMQAVKKYGKDQAFRFDPATVTMNHPEALIALLSGGTGIVAHWASPPFGQRELKDPAIRSLLDSDQVMGGPATFTMMSTTTKFRSENPRVYAAVLRALKEAQDRIATDKRAAAAVLLDSMGGKGWTVEELVRILELPTTRYMLKSENLMTYANFMQANGSLKHRPAAIGELFFDSPDVRGSN